MASREWRLNTDEVDELISDLKTAPSHIRVALKRFLNIVTLRYQREVAKRAGHAPFPRYTGASAVSVQRGVAVGVSLNYSGEVFSSLPHFANMEFGRRPGITVPFGDIFRWVELRAARGEIALDMSAGAGASTSALAKRNAISSATWRIQGKIRRVGTEGYHTVDRTIAFLETWLTRQVEVVATVIAQNIARGKR